MLYRGREGVVYSFILVVFINVEELRNLRIFLSLSISLFGQNCLFLHIRLRKFGPLRAVQILSVECGV